MDISSEVVIVGGGIIGLTTAYELAKEGLRVTVVDRQDFGQEASWAGAGILPPGNFESAVSPFDQLRSLSCLRFADFSAELRERTGIDNGYLRCGGLEFVAGEEPALPEEWGGAGVTVRALSEAQARHLEPALAPGLGATRELPDLAQVRNPRHINALVLACADLKVRLMPRCPLYELIMTAGRIQGLRIGQEKLEAKTYILAAGAWTDELLSALGRRLDIKPVRGQIALLHPGTPLIRHVLMWGDRYLVPRADGRVLVGSTEELVGYDRRTTAEAQRDLLSLACRLVPELAHAAVERCWAGLRPGSPDGLPFIGQVPGHDNLYVAAGHFRAGIQLSLGTAQLLKEMILSRPLAIPAGPFCLDRDRRA